MMVPGHAERPWLAWLLAVGLVLTGMAVIVGLFPRWPVPVPVPRPSAPCIILGGDKNALREMSELRIIRSPALIALSRGAVIPGGMAKRVSEVNPPMHMPSERSLRVERPPSVRKDSLITEPQGVLWRKKISDAGVSFGILKSLVFQQEQESEPRNVIVKYGDGLKDKIVEVPGWSWEPWVQSGLAWTLSFDIQSDDQGRITHVFMDVPATEAALNEVLIQSLYRQGRVRPPGPCAGRIEISFSGR